MEPNRINKFLESGKSFFKQMGFIEKWTTNIKFKESDQWPAITEKTKNLPRPILNFIRYVLTHVTSSVLSEPVKMVFDTEDESDEITEEAIKAFDEWSEKEWENIEQDKLNKRAVKRAALTGTGIIHYYLDTDVKGGKSRKYIGRLQGEPINIKNLFVGNPQQHSIQKQPYVLILSRETVEEAREEARKNGIKETDIALIVGDKVSSSDTVTESETHEVSDKVNIVTCYWKEKDGYIWLMKVCGETVVKKPVNTMHKLYPIAAMVWEEREECFYGISAVEGMINNQKAVNFMTAMDMMANQLTGMPKLMVKQGRVDNFNNDPATPIIDKNPTELGWPAQYLTPGTSSGKGRELVDFLLLNTKTLSGATETSTGELAKSSQMNYSAIVALQKAAGVPIEDIKDNYHQFVKDCGRIQLEFWQVNYNTERAYEVKNDDGTKEVKYFRGTDYKDINLKVKIDVGASTEYSEMLMMTYLEKFYDKGDMTFEEMLKYAPKNAIPFKEKILKDRQKQKEQADQDLASQILSMLPPEMQQMVMQQIQQQQQMQNMQQLPQPNSIPQAPQIM